eukprot:476835-Rhodomonas_salina.1
MQKLRPPFPSDAESCNASPGVSSPTAATISGLLVSTISESPGAVQGCWRLQQAASSLPPNNCPGRTSFECLAVSADA